jgi:hypothetical protein
MPIEPLMIDVTLDALASGQTLRAICRETGMSRMAFYLWRDADEANLNRYLKACEAGNDEMAEEKLEIADDKLEDAQSRKVRIHARDQYLAQRDNRYNMAKRLQIDANVKTATYALPPGATALDASRAYAEFIKNT